MAGTTELRFSPQQNTVFGLTAKYGSGISVGLGAQKESRFAGLSTKVG